MFFFLNIRLNDNNVSRLYVYQFENFFFHLQMSNRLPPSVNLKWCFADVSSFLADVSDVSALS